MATRSTIALENQDGTVTAVYCHWDGYLENNGRILKEHYSNPEKLQELLKGGAMSWLEVNPGDVKYYGDSPAVKFKDFSDYLRNNSQEEYDYILRQKSGTPVWYVSIHGDSYDELDIVLEEIGDA